MKDRRLALRYARALFQYGLERQEVERLGEELAGMVGVIHDTEGLREFLDHPRIAADRKREMVLELLADQVAPVLLQFLELVIRKGRASLLGTILEEYRRLQDTAEGIVRAHMTSAIALSEEEIDRYRRRLEEITGKQVVLTFQQDPSLVAGAVFRMGDRLIDASVRSYLQALRVQLKEVRVT